MLFIVEICIITIHLFLKFIFDVQFSCQLLSFLPIDFSTNEPILMILGMRSPLTSKSVLKIVREEKGVPPQFMGVLRIFWIKFYPQSKKKKNPKRVGNFWSKIHQ